jgi:hypothetical protein
MYLQQVISKKRKEKTCFLLTSSKSVRKKAVPGAGRSVIH